MKIKKKKKGEKTNHDADRIFLLCSANLFQFYYQLFWSIPEPKPWREEVENTVFVVEPDELYD